MHNIGEKIIYGSNGVMQISDIRDEEIGGVCRTYYVLKGQDASGGSYIYVPVDNEKLVSNMRKLLTREEIVEIIREAKSREQIEWINDNRARNESFKRIMQSGNRADIICMIGAIYNAGKERSKEGKKNFLSDENTMKKAERLIYTEFAAVLGIPEDEVPSFIRELK